MKKNNVNANQSMIVSNIFLRHNMVGAIVRDIELSGKDVIITFADKSSLLISPPQYGTCIRFRKSEV